ncbi:MAG: DUF2812 domain-containing protein, partial [Cellulosilyticaceae bacterium]
KYIYRFLNYLTVDYKALKMYLEEMALKGYELESIGTLGRGKFKKIEPRKIAYCVDLVDNQTSEAYEGLCEDSGWQSIKTGNYIRIYKAKEGIEPTPIHTDREIEKKQVIKTLLKTEGWMFLFGIIWLGFGIQEIATLNYYDLFDNFYLQNAWMKLALGGIYSIYSIYLIIFVIKSLRQEGYSPSLKGAKWRSRFYYGGALGLTCIWMWALFLEDMTLKAFIPVGMMIVVIIVMTIFYRKYVYEKLQNNKKKTQLSILYSIGMFVVMMGTFMISIALVLSTPYEPPTLEEGLRQAEESGALSLRDFPGFEDAQLERLWIESGESFALEKYYENDENYEEINFDSNLYKCKKEKYTEIIWEKLFDRYSDDHIAYGALEPIDASLFEVDQAYKHQNYNELLLRKDNTIVYIDCEQVDFYDEANVEIIKNVFK